MKYGSHHLIYSQFTGCHCMKGWKLIIKQTHNDNELMLQSHEGEILKIPGDKIHMKVVDESYYSCYTPNDVKIKHYTTKLS